LQTEASSGPLIGVSLTDLHVELLQAALDWAWLGYYYGADVAQGYLFTSTRGRPMGHGGSALTNRLSQIIASACQEVLGLERHITSRCEA
jgi:hypothetical protein